MRQKSGQLDSSSERIVKDIRRATRKQYSAEERIRVVLEGLRGEHSIAELRRRGELPSIFITAARRSAWKPASDDWLATRRGLQTQADPVGTRGSPTQPNNRQLQNNSNGNRPTCDMDFQIGLFISLKGHRASSSTSSPA